MPPVEQFSYADSGHYPVKRLAIRGIERLTGQPRLKRIYEDQRNRPTMGEDFWHGAIRRLELRVRYDEAALREVSAVGPLIVVANHPYGVLDGLVMGWLLAKRRQRFKILVNSVLYRVEDIRDFLLPIDFTATEAALRTNLASRNAARAFVKDGGCVAVFPGGTVSTSEKPFLPAVDPRWKPFTAQLVQSTRATVVPVFFEGQNSRLFQLASQISATLRLSLLFKEVAARIGTDLGVRIGTPVPFDDLPAFDDRQMFADWLRERTYGLGPSNAQGRIMLPLPEN
ncbi:MAG TPA: lysophospholipid acyltransferase family protein [Geminicoccus sp.]|jgi:putative hemolysin|uniref:lysophospholipid acyltransferase family protein n=1 Tax=Geminicoccus sp. TaxID=2024832 RepID=UPI002E321732|nr:lysophospholipid acyltransferase family protein [Geminicoccus sp.]HEX2528020.1 lysophospholipid acyltransferase family protein [Geminicoccus sp.]